MSSKRLKPHCSGQNRRPPRPKPETAALPKPATGAPVAVGGAQVRHLQVPRGRLCGHLHGGRHGVPGRGGGAEGSGRGLIRVLSCCCCFFPRVPFLGLVQREAKKNTSKSLNFGGFSYVEKPHFFPGFPIPPFRETPKWQ